MSAQTISYAIPELQTVEREIGSLVGHVYSCPHRRQVNLKYVYFFLNLAFYSYVLYILVNTALYLLNYQTMGLAEIVGIVVIFWIFAAINVFLAFFEKRQNEEIERWSKEVRKIVFYLHENQKYLGQIDHRRIKLLFIGSNKGIIFCAYSNLAERDNRKNYYMWLEGITNHKG